MKYGIKNKWKYKSNKKLSTRKVKENTRVELKK